MRRLLLVLTLAAWTHPAASARAEEPAAARSTRPSDLRARLVEAARHHLGSRFAGDCSAFVRRVFREAGQEMPPLTPGRSLSEALYRSLSAVARPRPGDLAFFHATYDRNRAGERRDLFTHVALVEAVEGTRVTLIHRGGRGIERISMNLTHPHDPAENGNLRRQRAGDRPGLRYLSGELFAGYATALQAPAKGARGSRAGRRG